MSVNPNFPVLDYAISWPNGPRQSSLQPSWCSVAERTDATLGGGTAGTRGKQYWLDQVQPGTLSLSLTNKDGALDPSNAASAFAPYVVPNRLFRMRAQWPPTDSLLTQNQATAGEAATAIGSVQLAGAAQVETPWPAGTVPPPWAVLAGAPTGIVTDPTAWQGSQVFASYWPAGRAYGTVAVGMQGWSVAPSLQHAASVWVRCATASVAVTVQPRFAWYAADGTLISTIISATTAIAAGPTAAWTQVSIAGTAPANAAYAVVQVVPISGPSTAWTMQTDGWDVRKNTRTPGYVTPGTWFPLFTGYIQGWPQRWTHSGIYGLSDVTVVDEFALLAQRSLLAPFKADLMALNPNFLYALDEASGTDVFADTAGKRGPATISRAGVSNSIQAGGTVTSGDNAPPGPDSGTALTGAFLGGAGPVLQSAPPPGPATAGYPVPTGALEIPPNPATGNTGPPASGAYTRLIAVRATSLPPQSSPGLTIWAPLAPNGYNGSPQIQTSELFANQWEFVVYAPNGVPNYGAYNLPLLSPSGVLVDTDWHLLGWSLSPNGLTSQLWADGSPISYPVLSSAPMWQPVGPPSAGYTDTIAAESFARNTVSGFWQGDVAFACELPIEMTGAMWVGLVQSWRNAWSTVPGSAETTDERYRRVLNWAGYVGPVRISPGLCRSVGPATDIAVAPTNPIGALQGLQNVVDTESGQHFVGADGAVVFQSRADRYNKTSTIVFGEKSSLGEVPYLDAQTAHDPSRVANDIQVTAQYGGALYRQQDAASQNTHGTIQLPRALNSIDPNELTAAAQALLLWNKDAQPRVKTLVVDPSSNPAVWPVILALELGVACQLNRRPQGAPAIALLGFIEQISWTLDGTSNQMRFTFQITPSSSRLAWQWNVSRWAPAAGSMTVRTALASTGTTLVIDTASTGTTASVAAGAYPVTVLIDNEQITLNTAPSGTTTPQTFTGVTRGANGSTPATHPAGSVLTLAPSTTGSSAWAY